MARVIAVANQKGGVAKTTTTAALAASWAERGRKVLAVDLDPQGSLTHSLGLEPDDLEPTIHGVLTGRTALEETILSVEEGFDLVPSNIDLAGAEAYLLSRTAREYVLREALEEVTDRYEILVIDFPPSLGVLTINALTAARPPTGGSSSARGASRRRRPRSRRWPRPSCRSLSMCRS